MPSHPSIQTITPNDKDQTPRYPTTSIFLAGTTEFATWRGTFLAVLEGLYLAGEANPPPYPSTTVYDPFQPNWTGDWREDLGDGRFRAQVEWELERQDGAAVVAFFLDERSRSPVSLLELGLCARSGKAVVGCERGYWKRGNVQAVCQRYGVPMADDLNGLVTLVADKLKGMKA
ncbi:hypothetical protein VSDG_00290 [Cytospora chrysosperma]|uniref:Uncharacterized protein n=1 Tax=Cytospora chrysosperma TaxID=252740 RepID=A0A423WPJ7_CYTCH|nr:hypothetical protein VSDG_00290 [Valsa sordida]